MAQLTRNEVIADEETENSRIVLGLLQSVESDGAQSQRRLSNELGIALGLVNLYIKRCIKKGLMKVTQAPAGRYSYYLTPRGFSEKSRLTVEYLSYSFSFFRQAKLDCAEIFAAARTRGMTRVVLCGLSDLAEIAALCAMENAIELIAVVDQQSDGKQLLKLPIVPSLSDVEGQFDAVVVTDLAHAREIAEAAAAIVGAERVLVPNLLRVRIGNAKGAAA